MAEARPTPRRKVSESEMEVYDLLTCPICQSVCEDPKILSCGHMSCSSCISDWVKKKDGQLWCPECNEQRQLPEGGIQSLQGSLRLKDACSLLRQKMDRLEADNGKCQKHLGMDRGLICMECHVAVCETCSKEDDHANHSCASRTRLMKDLEAKAKRAEIGMDQVDLLKQELDKNMEDGKDVIRDFTKRFDDARAQLTRQLEIVYKEKADLLVAQKSNISASIDGIRSLHQVLVEEKSIDVRVAIKQLKALPDDDEFIPKAASLLGVKMEAGVLDKLYSQGKTQYGEIVSCGPPSPSKCEVQIGTSNLLVRGEIKMHLVPKDEQGCIVTSEQCHVMSVDIFSPSGERVVPIVQKEENGRFLISFVPQCVGWYEITAKVHQKAINRDPLRLAVKPRGREVDKIVGNPSFTWPHDVLKLGSNLIVLDKYVNVVHMDGKVIQTFPNKNWFFYPYSVAYHDQVFYVTAMNGQAVIAYRPNGEEIRRFRNSRLKKPTGIAVDRGGWVYVADSQLSKILVFSKDGEFRQFIQTDTALKIPWFIKFNPKGELVVADCRNKRVVVLNVDTGSELVSIYVQHQGQPMLCRGVDVDRHGNIYVAARIEECGFECINVYGPDGEFVGSIAESPSKQGLRLVRGIHLATRDGKDVLYVVDGDNKCIRIYEL